MKDTFEIVGDIMEPVIDLNEFEAYRGLKLLLDTHIWLWSRSDPKLIGQTCVGQNWEK